MGTIIGPPNPRGDERAPSLDTEDSEVVGDRDLLPAAIILWVASLVRVAYGFARGEAFVAEAVLAFLCVVLVPWLCLVSYRNEVRRRESSSGPGERSASPAARAELARVIPLRVAVDRVRTQSGQGHRREEA